MKRLFALLSLSMAALCAQAAPPAHATHASLDARLASLHQASRLPGFAVAVVSDKDVLYQRGFGYADLQARRPYTVDTVQNVGSVSKTVIGVALVKAIELGYFGLDTEIDSILPFKVRHPHTGLPITVRHLVTHTSGILDDDEVYGHSYIVLPGSGQTSPLREQFARTFTVPGRADPGLGAFLKDYLAVGGRHYKPGNFAKPAPGSAYHYSNIGSALAAYLVELRSGERFDEFTRRTIFAPLQMRATSWRADPAHAGRQALAYNRRHQPYPPYALITYPDGGLTTSAADLTRFLMAMVKGYKGGEGVLSKAGFTLLFDPQFAPDALPAGSPAGEPNSGVFWRIRRNGQVGHTGSDPGVTAFMFIDPASSTGRLLITNTEFSGPGEEDDPKLVRQFREVWQTLGEVRGEVR
ncbi:serine hydrolase [Massilia sp. MS-15]|uniref:serine hydrolase domain-containing protein n=1 Tax=Massilia sp. MS-15 TaxID=2878200 RepID=UPI001CD38343|nr:serine hydrolase domain-containing protein [Massilia sp. MS-15]MCA1246838.1 beta-lactamase family protein [Massilia sp. MS-15]